MQPFLNMFFTSLSLCIVRLGLNLFSNILVAFFFPYSFLFLSFFFLFSSVFVIFQILDNTSSMLGVNYWSYKRSNILLYFISFLASVFLKLDFCSMHQHLMNYSDSPSRHYEWCSFEFLMQMSSHFKYFTGCLLFVVIHSLCPVFHVLEEIFIDSECETGECKSCVSW